MADLLRRVVGRLGRREPSPALPKLSFGTWDRLAAGTVVSVCHPEWRGIRTAAYGFGGPVVEVADAACWADDLVDGMRSAGVTTVVVQGFPPGSDVLLSRAAAAGLATRVVVHSSTVQHGGEAAEAEVADRVLELAAAGTVERVGFVKAGMAEPLAALGYPVFYVPNRVPRLPPFEPVDLGPGRLHVGVFAEPFWRKNVVTQLAAVALLPDAIAHVMRRPAVRYLERMEILEHGTLPWEEFVRLQGSVDLNLYVTLSECHPLSPLESYAAGVPCLISPTSALFESDPELRAVTSVAELDDPVAIAAAATALLERGEEVVTRARVWMERFDAEAARRWEEFVGASGGGR